ncbi:MAG: hypothetical protein L0241_17700 [Planctomycetia bacterium]|nr:hypothetical protein [Planctomycetia bacterium]
MQLLTAGKRHVIELAFSPDNLALVATSSDHVPVMWELPATGDPVPLADESTYTSHDITFSPDSTVIGWLAGQKRREFDRRIGTKRAIQLIAPEERLNAQAICGPDNRLVVRTIQNQVGFRIHAFAPDGPGGWTESWVVGPDDNLSGWELAGTTVDRFYSWEGPRWSDQGRRQFVARSSLTGDIQFTVTTTASWIHGIVSPPDGSVAVGIWESSLLVWRPDSKVEKKRTGTLRHYRSLAFHPTGRYLLAGSNDTTARLIDTESWVIAKQFTWSIGRLTAVAVSPDGMLAAAGGDMGRVVVWDLDV